MHKESCLSCLLGETALRNAQTLITKLEAKITSNSTKIMDTDSYLLDYGFTCGKTKQTRYILIQT